MPIVSAPRVVAGGRVLAPGAVVVEDGRVAGVLDRRPVPAPDHLALDRGVLAPGLIDLQLNGAFGVDLVDAAPQDWERVVRRLPSTGVTGFLATFISAPVGDLVAAMGRAVTARAASGRGGSRLLGVHLEGPFLSPRRRGAHDADHLVDPTAELVDRLMEAGAGILSLITLAPERDGALEAAKRLAGAGVLVSVGHSDARAEGVAGQALADPRLAGGLIADLHHVHPAVCRVVMEAARDRVALVTDAVSALGMPPGSYELGSEVVELREGSPPLRADSVWLSDSWRALATWVEGLQVWRAAGT